MARIRTIKPEFFTSEDIVSLSPLARLLYVALWCEADREGRLSWKPRTFKLRYLPADDCSIEALCAELVERGLVTLYGEGLAFIPAFSDHQHINPRESASTLPEPNAAGTRQARVATRQARDSDAQVGREGKGKEGVEEANASLSAGAEPPPCPHADIVALYHELLPANPRMKVWDGARESALRTRWREDAKRQSLDYWRRFFTHVAASPFLTGKVAGKGDRAFLPGLDWLVTAGNFAKVIEGRYHEREVTA